MSDETNLNPGNSTSPENQPNLQETTTPEQQSVVSSSSHTIKLSAAESISESAPVTPNSPASPDQTQPPESEPKIVHYLDQNQPIQAAAPTPAANPTPGPPQPPAPKPQPTTPEAPVQPIAENQPSEANPPVAPPLQPNAAPKVIPPVNLHQKRAKSKNTKFLKGCLSALGCGAILFILLLLFAIQQIGFDNPITRALNIDQDTFVNLIIVLNSLFFGFFTLTSFIVAIVGVFRASNARKDDKVTKRKGITTALISGLIFIFMAFAWIGTHTFLQSKLSGLKPAVEIGINTEPKNTILLTAPIKVTFDTSRIPFDTKKYRLINVEWDFGDGSKGSGQKVSHTYDKKGDTGLYTAKLTILRQNIQTGERDQVTYEKDISIANETVNVQFSATPEEGEAPLEVEFDASESIDPDGSIQEWEWDFDGDGNYDDGNKEKMTFTYEKVGSYDVKLRVIDSNGNPATITKTIIVKAPNKPTAVITTNNANDKKFTTGKKYTFKADKSSSPSGKITSYNWDFGDNSPTVKNRTATHVFKEAGKYEVTLIVTDDEGNKGEVTQTLTVEDSASAPVAKITTTPALKPTDTTLKGKAPFEIAFSAKNSSDKDNNIVDYEWDFDNDGVTDSVGKEISHEYTKPGVYTAVLTIIDADDNQASESINITVEKQEIKAKVSATPTQGTVPLTVSFDATGSSYPDGEIVSYEWDFGDDTRRIDSSKVSYKYTKIGTFTAKVTAIGNDNKRSTAEISVNVRPISLQACFTPSRDEGEAPLTVIFDPKCSAGTIAKYNWDFGDQETDNVRKPTHTYLNPGLYTVVLEVADNQNVVNKYEQKILVTGDIE